MMEGEEEGEMTGKEEKERELNDDQRGLENKDAGRHETWLFSACRHSLFSPFPHAHSKQASQTTVSTSEKKRGGDRETD